MYSQRQPHPGHGRSPGGLQVPRRLAHQGGSALMAAFWMMVVLLLAGLAASFSSTTEVSLSGNDRTDAQIFYLAEAGLAQTKKYLDSMGIPFEGSGPTRSAPRNIFLDEPIGAPGGVQGRFTSYVDKQENLNGKPTKYLAITVRATIPGVSMTKVVQEMVAQDNFAKYAYFTNEERMPDGTIVWFTTGDIIRGPLHTNDQLNIDGDPIFLKEVSTSASSVNYGSGTNNPDFQGGITFDADAISLPDDTSLIRTKAQETDGLYFGSSASLELAYDDTTGYANVLVDIAGTVTDYQIPMNGVLYVDGNVRIKGRLGGQLTVACSGDMYIDDDIHYRTDPRVDPTCTDLLGLVAEGDVYISDTPENLDSGDETIMAVIMAMGTSFAAEDHASGTPRGYLRVIGGMIQERRGPVGTFDASTGALVSGYEKDYVYDQRLADSPPPAFPTTGRVLSLAWKEMNPSYDISSNVF
ncbi:MAG: DUF4900 domain-containing protein [bacterium]